MNEHFDDIIKKGLDNLDSQVPDNMFDRIRSRMADMDADFDATIQSKVEEAGSPIPTGAFEQVQNELAGVNLAFDAAIVAAVGTVVSSVPANVLDKVTATLTADSNQFDNAIKSKMHQYGSVVPADMWQRIQQEKRKRRPVAWWWVAAALLLLGSGCLWLIQDENANSSHVANNKKSKEIAETKKVHAVLPSNASSNEITNADTIKLASLAPAVNENKNSQPVKNPSSSKVNIQNKDTVHSLSKHPSDNIAFSKSHKTNDVSNNNNSTKSFTYHKKSNAAASIKLGKVNGQNVKDDTADDEIVLNGSNKENAASDISARQLAFRQMIHLDLLKKLSANKMVLGSLKRPEMPCPVNGDKHNDWYLELYVSPTITFKRLEDQLNGKNTKTGMDSTLHRQVSFNAGFNIAKNIGEHGLIKAGLQYNQTNEVLRSTRVKEIKVITTISVRTVILSPGDTVYIRDTTVKQQIGTATIQSQNKYRSWDIPVILGYQFGGENLHLNANLGFIANIRSSYKGEMLDTAQQSINIASYKNNGIYKTNVGFSLYAGLGIVKVINDRVEFLLEPHARINLSNTATNAAWFRQKNIMAGLSIGLRYKLNGSRQR